MKHVTLAVEKFPSRGIFYDFPEVKLREMKFVEVEEMALTPRPNLFNRLLALLKEGDIVQGCNPEDLTIYDFEFLLVSISAITFPELEYQFTAPCPKCKGTPKVIKLTLKGKEKEIVLDSVARAVILPTQLAFRRISEDVQPPIQVELSSGVYTCDFPRIKHYSLIEEIAKDLGVHVSKVPITHSRLLKEIIPGLDVDTLTVDDWEILNGLYSYLNHDIEDVFKAKCKACGTEVEIKVDWEVIDLYPFRGAEVSWRDKVRFGKGVAPTDRCNRRNRVSEGNRPLPKVDIVAEE